MYIYYVFISFFLFIIHRPTLNVIFFIPIACPTCITVIHCLLLPNLSSFPCLTTIKSPTNYTLFTQNPNFRHRPSPPSAMVKQVQTDLSPVLKLYTDGTVERLFGSAHVPPSPEDASTGVSSKDTVISPEVSARIYLPRIAGGRRKIPILVYYHGGGFCLESAFSFLDHRYINLVSAAAGALVVSVEYRLAPEHPLPAAFIDSWEALKWVCSHGAHSDENTHFEKDEWINDHGDLNQIFVGGDSAGGTIAHNIALRAGSVPLPGNAKVAGAILSHPYFWGSDPIGNEPKEGIEETLLYRLWMFAHPTAAGGIDNPLINPLADPAISGLGCSKLMVSLSEKDQLAARGLAYVEKVKESGWKGEIEVVVVDGEDHCFQIFDPETEKAKDLICRIANFISGSGN
ncbi:alpha/beta-Hydrolases superfamily protein [Striga asiatica]|uniref:Alpha/beta-Hydrolases superfamily protein n=1 Tax=Striga asiatica TaxID=4170 RepID=A0A5A7NXS6_STRAF|nr:alpha/beta-Hydrolases superfamily protein [Striga asiatica]